VHVYDHATEELSAEVLAYARQRMAGGTAPLGTSRSVEELAAEIGETITEEGLGPRAWRLFVEQLLPACIPANHPRHLSFIPSAPSHAAMLFDLAIASSAVYAGSWLEGGGAVFAENQALRWLADLAGFPAQAGGVFVSGGTTGNLSALVTARASARRASPTAPARWRIAVGGHTHSSVVSACEVMDVDVLVLPEDEHGRLTGDGLRRALDSDGGDGVFAVVATAGTTGLGIVDDLASLGPVCAERGLWLHVDGAYGLAAMADPQARPLFDGIEAADSFIVDPHKWLFTPYDSCAIVYRDLSVATRAHTQRAGYLDVLTESGDFNPSDHVVGLSRRARGLPFWFSLATHGTTAYAAAIRRTLEVARYAADRIRERPELELLREPELSVVAFRRRGWTPENYRGWSEDLRLRGFALVTPTVQDGETVARFALVNPRTSETDIDGILDTMREGAFPGSTGSGW
jgi:glutamate/tyrosine decarboxylase-like PLP-dependent enzyme